MEPIEADGVELTMGFVAYPPKGLDGGSFHGRIEVSREFEQVAGGTFFQGQLMGLAGAHEEYRVVADGVADEVDMVFSPCFFQGEDMKEIVAVKGLGHVLTGEEGF